MTSQRVARAFGKAARSYDVAAGIQAQVAETLVATASFSAPQTILDIGCGTGLVLAQTAERWPDAGLTRSSYSRTNVSLDISIACA
jgi:malonyl-CoA O-methyltransferase